MAQPIARCILPYICIVFYNKIPNLFICFLSFLIFLFLFSFILILPFLPAQIVTPVSCPSLDQIGKEFLYLAYICCIL